MMNFNINLVHHNNNNKKHKLKLKHKIIYNTFFSYMLNLNENQTKSNYWKNLSLSSTAATKVEQFKIRCQCIIFANKIK